MPQRSVLRRSAGGRNIWTGILLAAILAVTSPGHSQTTKVKAGDYVRFKYAGESVVGRVVGASSAGLIGVEFEWEGKKTTKRLPAKDLEVTEKPAEKPTPSRASSSTTRPAPGRSAPATSKSKPSEESPEVELRTWTNDTGKFQIEARFAGIKDGKVQLKKEDGTTIAVPLDKLSDADRELAEELNKADENPFASSSGGAKSSGSKTTASGSGSKSKGPAIRSSTLPIRPGPVDWSNVTATKGDLIPAANLQISPDESEPAEVEVSNRPYIFASQAGLRSGKSVGIGFFENPETVLIDDEANQAVVVLVDGSPGQPKTIRTVRIDLKDGKATSTVFPSCIRLGDYHAATRRFLCFTDFFTHPDMPEPQLFGLWQQDKSSFEPQGVWSLTNKEHNPHSQYAGGVKFAGPDHAIAWYFPGRYALWNTAEGQPIAVYEGQHRGTPAVSPNGKHIAIIGSDGRAMLIETATGEILGRLPQKNLEAVAFHPRGKLLAASSPQRVIVYDLEAGQSKEDVFLNKSTVSAANRQGLVWLDDRFLLSNNETVIDLEKSTVLWRYEIPTGWGGTDPTRFHAGRFWYAIKSKDGKEAGLFQVKLPHPEAIELADTLDRDKLLVLRPGATIRLVLNVNAPAEEQARIKESLTRAIEAQGMSVGDNGDLVLTATTSTGQTRSQTYQFFGAQANQTVTATEQISTVRLAQGGQSLWEAQAITGGYAPFMIHLREGQSAQDYVNSMQKPNFVFFHEVEFPSKLAKVPEAGAYGFSKLTHNGVEKSAPPAGTPQGPGSGLSF